ncbi:MAG: UDP-N-acetylmuramoyl-tripeptide--D-alanyl-D-alanine ligase [Bacteroidales bacterium]|nr:UDP-N-acetylmuramoyl-tripeptide--D-alanyl-D-alanine ligase [Bacteroidales bacterium]
MQIEQLYHLFMQCNGVTTDSRNCPKDSLFIALKGENFNGNKFAAKALEAGCKYAVIDDASCLPSGDDARSYALVDDTLTALQQLANYHRRQLATPIIGITGTNGKTTTKELMAAVLSTHFNILYTQGNLNNSIGVPLTLLRLKPEHQLGVVEMGASHPGDIKELVDIAEPDFGLITNVGKAHLLGFGNLEGVIKTKGELFDYLRAKKNTTIFLHRDNDLLQRIAGGLNAFTYGQDEQADVQGEVTGNSPFLSFRWKYQGSTQDVSTQLIGAYNFPNAMAAVAVGLYFGVDKEDIGQALRAYAPQNNRSQLKQTESNMLIIDAYNANPTSMRASVKNFYEMQADDKLLILGDMRELGTDSLAEHQDIADYLTACGFTQVILVGEQFAQVKHPFRSFPNVESLIVRLQEDRPHGKTILIKGSNGIHLNQIIEYL